MTTFALFALLGLAVVGVWVAWHRRKKRILASESPSARSPVSAELKSVHSRDEATALSTQTLESAKLTSLVALPESTDDSIVAVALESHSTAPCAGPDNAAPEIAADSRPIDSRPTVITAAMPTPVADSSPKSTSALETQVSTLTETINVNDQPALVETSAGQCISTKTVDEEEKQSSLPIILPAESNMMDAEHAIAPVEYAFNANVPPDPASEAKESSVAPTVQADTGTTSPHKPALPPVFENDQPGVDVLSQPSSEATIPTKLPGYRPLAPASPTAPSRPRCPVNIRAAPNANVDFRLRVQLVFSRSGAVKTLALIPDRREGMPDEIEISGTQGELRLSEPLDDCYELVPLMDAGNALQQGIEWRERGKVCRWRWVLSGRELYVLTPGDEFGLSGFVSTARLLLNARHVVLATARLRDGVLSTLADTGCVISDASDDTTPGVPAGWLIFRDVTPTRAVPMRDEAHILNALCPLPNVEPHFVGGIRLERRTWLAGFPPRIRFTGALGDDFRPTIDGQPAHPATDGAFEAPGWDSTGVHRLWFGGQTETYALHTMDENWEFWRAHDFGTGTAICGGATYPPASIRQGPDL